MNVDAYLAHIGYQGSRAPNLQTLRALMLAHLYRVPFENLSIHYGEAIQLDPHRLFDKIVNRGRGGFCYELNTLFGELLRNLGFRVDLLSARVAGKDGKLGPDFDHMALLVHLEQPYLADVGFGETFREPLAFDGQEYSTNLGSWRIRPEGNGIILEQAKTSESWLTEYRFTTEPRRLEQFLAMCHHNQTSPQSHFPQKRICSLALPSGRITLSHRTLIRRGPGGDRQEEVLPDEETWHAVLAREFGIHLPASARRVFPLATSI